MPKAIIYDKDGTLIKFEPFWVPVAKAAIRELFDVKDTDPEKIANAVTEAEIIAGIHGETLDPSGILSKANYDDVASIFNEIYSRNGILRTITRRDVENAIDHNLNCGKIEAACENLREVLENARSRAALFIVTTDNREITAKCLNSLGIADLFDGVYCDDGTTPAKPDPAAANEIMKNLGAKPSEVYMIGDTMTDARFAANAKIGFVSVGNDEQVQAAAKYAAVDVADATRHILGQSANAKTDENLKSMPTVTLNFPPVGAFEAAYYVDDDCEIQPPKRYSPHIHDTIEFYFLLDGEASFSVENKVYALAPGDAVLSQPNELHHCIHDVAAPHAHACVWFTPGDRFLFDAFLKTERRRLSLDADGKAELLRTLDALKTAAKTHDKQSQYAYLIYLLNLLRPRHGSRARRDRRHAAPARACVGAGRRCRQFPRNHVDGRACGKTFRVEVDA